MSSLNNGDSEGSARLGVWRRSTFCASGECVEIASSNGAILVRDSKALHSEPLRFTQSEFRAFVLGAAAGEYNDFAGL
jgi:hypothetical protein